MLLEIHLKALLQDAESQFRDSSPCLLALKCSTSVKEKSIIPEKRGKKHTEWSGQGRSPDLQP